MQLISSGVDQQKRVCCDIYVNLSMFLSTSVKPSYNPSSTRWQQTPRSSSVFLCYVVMEPVTSTKVLIYC